MFAAPWIILVLDGGDSHRKSLWRCFVRNFETDLKRYQNVLKRVHLKFNLASKWIG